MANRRELLQLGITASVVSFLPAHTLASASSLLSHKAVCKVLYDTRFQDSMALARTLTGEITITPAAPQGVDGDITRFWTHDLPAVCLESPQAIAGVTGERIVFCLEQFAREKNMRVVWQKIHTDYLLCDPVTGSSEKLVSWLLALPAST